MNTKGLNKSDLQLIAIIAMVIDHTAWGFVEFMSPLGQTMHIFGRLTLPIMCFFIAEGFRRTSNLTKYIYRLMSFSLVSIIPFYMFFHEEYFYRQNILFDELLALLALSIAEHKNMGKALKTLLIAIIIAVSFAIGGWVLLPIIYTFIFYYGKDFKQKATLFTIFTVVFCIILSGLIVLNQHIHFSRYNWTVSERLYLLGFILALIPLYFYNGQKGNVPFGKRYFFYVFYPFHFLVLLAIKYCTNDPTPQGIYIAIHVIALFIGLFMLLYTISLHSSRAQMTVTFFMVSANMYIFGFLAEITTTQLDGVYTATKVQYFAECLIFLSITMSMQELCHTRIPHPIYAAEAIVSIFVMYCMFTYKQNGLMYKKVTISHDGPFPKMHVEGYGIAFYLFLIYAALVCIYMVYIGIKTSVQGDSLTRKRLRGLLFAMLVMWVPVILKFLGLTAGYEFPVLGIPFAAAFVTLTLSKYSYLDSVTLDFSNAVRRGKEGILVVDKNYKVLYKNEWIIKLFGEMNRFDDTYQNPVLKEIFNGNLQILNKDEKTYEIRVEPLVESGHETGKILWIIDLTEHYQYLSSIEESASKDSLTGIYNRGWFEEQINSIISQRRLGAFFMLDLDNFKGVNDNYGHQAGDEVLTSLSAVIQKVTQESRDNQLISGRIGGDEFCLFIVGMTDKGNLSALANKLISYFDLELDKTNLGRITSISMGISILDKKTLQEADLSYELLYKRADDALYLAKEKGKKTFAFFS
ncbi:MAG: diguanylate cyclase [Butyrivibrio sp.]|nr:diguanylate cyclase [Butyrivibrio sp.]